VKREEFEHVIRAAYAIVQEDLEGLVDLDQLRLGAELLPDSHPESVRERLNGLILKTSR
jgi:hypothetical protein